MRWLIEEKKNSEKFLVGKKGPEIGDVKIKVKFAFWPIKLNTTEVVWLERYIEIYEYKIKFNKSLVGRLEILLGYNQLESYFFWSLKEKRFYDPIKIKQFNKL